MTRQYNGHWLDSFHVSKYEDNERPNSRGKILLETPHCDYLMSPEQWNEFKKKVNDFDM